MKLLNKSGGLKKTITYVLLLLVSGLATYYGVDGNNTTAGSLSGVSVIDQAFEQQQSGLWVEVDGIVVKILPDDNEGSRHQKFILEVENGRTLMVAHNIDLAPRVPLSGSDRLNLRGRYEWNEKGGVLHWTHHDPNKKIIGGWIEYKGRRYQ